MTHCTCAESNARGATSPDYRCAACGGVPCPECNNQRAYGPDPEGFYDCGDCGAAWLPGSDELYQRPEEVHYCEGCGEHYNMFQESHVGHAAESSIDRECGQPWTTHADDGVQMLCPEGQSCSCPDRETEVGW